MNKTRKKLIDIIESSQLYGEQYVPCATNEFQISFDYYKANKLLDTLIPIIKGMRDKPSNKKKAELLLKNMSKDEKIWLNKKVFKQITHK